VDAAKKSRTFRSRTERDELVAKWRASGMSVPDFAAAHGLPPSNLYQWIRALKDAQASPSRSKSTSARRKAAPKASFAEVSVVGQAAPRGLTMTIALAGGHTVTFEGGIVDAAWLHSVLKVVRAC
jgi:transposase-like protein